MDHHVQAVLRTIDQLDLNDLHQAYRGTGSPPYRPELMLAVVLCETLRGQTSPAVWHKNANSRDHNDNGTLDPMIKKSQQITGNLLEVVHADSGYCSILNLKDSQSLGINLYAPVQDNTAANRKLANGQTQIPSMEFTFEQSTRRLTCPGGHAMKLVKEVQVPRACGRIVGELRYEQSVSRCSSCPLASQCLGNQSKRRTVSRQSEQFILDAQQQKMLSDQGKRNQRLPGQVIERRFADGKLHRNQGEQNGRGLPRVPAEVGLLVVAQNTLTLYNTISKNTPQQHSHKLDALLQP